MLGLLIAPLSEIKSYVEVLSFYIKMMKQRLFRPVVLKHSIKKGMFSVQGKLILFKLGRGESSPRLHPPWLRTCYACVFLQFRNYSILLPSIIQDFSIVTFTRSSCIEIWKSVGWKDYNLVQDFLEVHLEILKANCRLQSDKGLIRTIDKKNPHLFRTILKLNVFCPTVLFNRFTVSNKG